MLSAPSNVVGRLFCLNARLLQGSLVYDVIAAGSPSIPKSVCLLVLIGSPMCTPLRNLFLSKLLQSM